MGFDEYVHDETKAVTLFPNLKQLRFASMSNWHMWTNRPQLKVDSVMKIMPHLEYLEFDMCADLCFLPDFLQKTPLEHLIIKRSQKLEEGCREQKENVWKKLAHARNISFLRN